VRCESLIHISAGTGGGNDYCLTHTEYWTAHHASWPRAGRSGGAVARAERAACSDLGPAQPHLGDNVAPGPSRGVGRGWWEEWISRCRAPECLPGPHTRGLSAGDCRFWWAFPAADGGKLGRPRFREIRPSGPRARNASTLVCLKSAELFYEPSGPSPLG
jgi:hypothetical protein